MATEYLQDFKKARRESQKLLAALVVLDPSAELTEEERETFLHYLHFRRRSAAEHLIGKGDCLKLEALLKLEPFSRTELEEYRRKAALSEQTEVWSFLMQWPDEMPGAKAEAFAREEASRSQHYLAAKIWRLTVQKLTMGLHDLGPVLQKLTFRPETGEGEVPDDGFRCEIHRVSCREDWLCKRYLEGPEKPVFDLLHLLVHQLLLHPLFAEGKEKRLWDLACDMTVEHILDTPLFAGFGSRDRDRHRFFLKEYHLPEDFRTAEELYRYLVQHMPKEAVLTRLEEAYYSDRHAFWRILQEETPPKKEENRQQEGGEEGSGSSRLAFFRAWTDHAKEVNLQLDPRHLQRGAAAGSGRQQVRLLKKEGYDYRRFLERFMVCQEEVELDLDSFDYLPYWYSREHYDKIILLEPLEYKEIHKLEELVIAIDTSGSCSGKVVKRFLEETWEILHSRGNFFQKMNVHLIQCDSMIQEHVVLRSREEFLDYMDHVEVKGLGGTDFRPVFRLIEKLQEQKELLNLKGLLYFTDGDGIYPPEAPGYDTAFVFLNKALEKHEIPPWGIRLNLGIRDLE